MPKIFQKISVGILILSTYFQQKLSNMLQKLIYNYAAFNIWANQKIVSWLSNADEQALYAQVQSSFTSIDYTLQHILRTERFWQLFITQQELKGFNWAVREGDVKEVMQDLLAASTLLEGTVRAFSESDLTDILTLDMPWAKNNLSRYEYVQHVINHSSFHRGQIITIARQVGITTNVPSTDYNIFNTELQSPK